MFSLLIILAACDPFSKAGRPLPTPSVSVILIKPPATPSAPSTAVIVDATPGAHPGQLVMEKIVARSSKPIDKWKIIHTYPHDREAFTQGLAFWNGAFYESTGLNGKSTLRKFDLESGTVSLIHSLPEQYFGEGITIMDNRLYFLTWKNHMGFIYNPDTLEKTGEFTYPNEGWGITHDGSHLIMSDGSPSLYFLDPITLQITANIIVHDDQTLIPQLNELEYVNGDVYANIWQSDYIVRINPQTGEVRSWLDLRTLLSPEDRLPPVNVLNGMAYHPESGHMFVTGKLWPKLFEIVVEGEKPE